MRVLETDAIHPFAPAAAPLVLLAGAVGTHFVPPELVAVRGQSVDCDLFKKVKRVVRYRRRSTASSG
jgi:hypothetical protein